MRPTVVEESITLNQAFHGTLLKVKIKRKVICQDCNGKGGSKVDTCSDCKGRGVVKRMVQLGPGMYS